MRSLFTTLLFVVCLQASEAAAQFLIYSVEFTASPGTPEFEFYESGWVIADIESGKTSFVLTAAAKVPEVRVKGYYVISRNTAEFFFSSEGEQLKGNIRAASNNGQTQTSWLLTGEVSAVVQAGEQATAVPATMSGFMLASSTGTYVEKTISGTEKMNLVGMMEISTELDTSATSYFNRADDITMEKIIGYIKGDLDNAGYVAEE